MPSKVRFLTPAQRDLEGSSLWYENQGNGLGLQFIAVIEDCLLTRLLKSKKWAVGIPFDSVFLAGDRTPYNYLFLPYLDP